MSPAAHALDRRLLELRSEHESYTTRLTELEANATYIPGWSKAAA